VNGGMGGGTSRVVQNPGTPQEKEVRAFSDDNIWKKGDLVRVYTAGGGGWGDPLERETDNVLNDVLDGFVSVAAALESYGVVIDPDTLVIDERATTAERQALGASRGPTKLFHRFEYFDTAEEELEWVEKNIPR
jgi:N-methylhydantoinase B